ncbi:MAG: DUF3619 family protein [Pseudomonadota bacterium]
MNPTDINFAYKIRHALNEHVDSLPPETINRLVEARKTAVSRKKNSKTFSPMATGQLVPNTAGTFFDQPFSWLGRFGVVAPLVLGVALFVGMYDTAQQQRIDELAEMDIAVLSDELTLLAYLDTGFNAYLAKRAE